MELGLTQPMLVARLNLLGWDVSRETLAKIESRIRWVADAELLCLAEALGKSVEELLPKSHIRKRALVEFLSR